MSGTPWGALVLEIPECLEDPLVGLTAHCSLGAESRSIGERRGRLTIYFPSLADAHSAAQVVSAWLPRIGHDADSCALRAEGVEHVPWVERYQAGLRPFALGRGFCVDPTGSRGGFPGRRCIELTPGRAFGTGEHPTTQLCVMALERIVREGGRWVDLGCGSSILSLVSRWGGASRVLALDIDPVAAQVGRDVTRRNGEERAVDVVHGSVACARPDVWDGVVANIASSYFEEHAAPVAALLREGGTLIAAGFLEQQRSGVRDALMRAGLVENVEERRSLDGWSLLVFARPLRGDG